MIAEEQDGIHRRADPAFAGFDQSEPHIARRIRDPVEVARDAAFGCENHDAAGVRKLRRRLVVNEAVSDGRGELLDLRLVTGKKMPAVNSAGTAVKPGIHDLLRVGEHGFFRGINAEGDDVEILANTQRDFLQCVQRGVEHFGAKHRTLIVNERKDCRLILHELAQCDGCAMFVAKRNIERNLIVQLLIQPNILQHFRLARRVLQENILRARARGER